MPHFRLCAASALLAGALLSQPAFAESAPPPAIDWSKAQTVEVVMTNYAFTPKALQFRANTPYRLHLVNNAEHGHSFDAPELFAAARVATEDQFKISDGDVEVDGGKSLDVKFIPAAAGTYKFHCSHFMHSTFGMTGEAVVQ